MAEHTGYNPSSYYHTLIFYPYDYMTRASPVPLIGKDFSFLEHLTDIFYKVDAEFLISPFHTPDGDDLKPHFHLLTRCGSKMSGNSFQAKLSDGLDGNFNGFAYSPKMGVVTRPDRYIRYMIHKDNPGKQQFEEGYNAIKGVGNWSKELYNAFQDDILADLYDYTVDGYMVKDISNIPLFRYALTQGRNLYLINTIKQETKGGF